jgi:hypothetical protein
MTFVALTPPAPGEKSKKKKKNICVDRESNPGHTHGRRIFYH